MLPLLLLSSGTVYCTRLLILLFSLQIFVFQAFRNFSQQATFVFFGLGRYKHFSSSSIDINQSLLKQEVVHRQRILRDLSPKKTATFGTPVSMIFEKQKTNFKLNNHLVSQQYKNQ